MEENKMADMNEKLEAIKAYDSFKIDDVTKEKKFDPIVASKKVNILSKTQAGKGILAAQMREQMVRELIYEGRARQLLDVYALGTNGETAEFDADLDVPAAELSINGLPIISDVKSDRIRIETSPINCTFLVKWVEQSYRKFDVMDNARRRAQGSIQLMEDFRFYSLIKYAVGLTNQLPVISLGNTTAASNNPTNQNSVENGKVSPMDIAKSIGALRAKLLPIGACALSPGRLTDFLLFNVSTTSLGQGGYGIFAPAIQEQALKTGLIGEVFGVPMFDMIVIPDTEVYTMAPREYVGKLVVRTDIEIKYLSDVSKAGEMFSAQEDIGMLARYAKGLCLTTIVS
jgi:hypothetical protein